jgi:chitin synthase
MSTKTIAKKSSTLALFWIINGLGVLLIFIVPFYAYVWLLSISNVIRCISILAVLYSWFTDRLQGCCIGRRTHRFNTIEASYVQKTILFVVPCYTETREELMRTFDSFVKQSTKHRTVLAIVVDGMKTGKESDMATFQIVTSLLGWESPHYSHFEYTSWKGITVPLMVLRGMYRGVLTLVFVKKQNMGKKDGLILIRELLLAFNRTVNHRQRDALTNWFCSVLQDSGITYLDYICGTDADTVLSPNALESLTTKMVMDPRLIGVSGNVKLDFNVNNPMNPLVAYQCFEYTYGQLCTRSSQGVFGKVTCLPGCIQIFTSDPEIMQEPLETFKRLPENTLFENVLAFLGEDRRFTCLLLYYNHLKRTDLSLEAIGYTAVPNTLSVFFSQRRRWFLSAQANNVLDTLSPKLPLMIRIMAAVQIWASSITPFVFVAVLFAVLRMVQSDSNKYYILFLGTSSLVWIFKLGMVALASESLKEALCMSYGLIVHSIFGAFIQTWNILHALWTIDDLRWGLTRQAKENLGETDTEISNCGDETTILVVDEQAIAPQKLHQQTSRDSTSLTACNTSESRGTE